MFGVSNFDNVVMSKNRGKPNQNNIGHRHSIHDMIPIPYIPLVEVWKKIPQDHCDQSNKIINAFSSNFE